MSKILIIDDKKEVLHLIKCKLELVTNATIDIASTSTEAINFLSNHYNVVVSDLKLENDKINGLDILKMFKESYKETKTILYTAYSLEELDYSDVDDIEIITKDNNYDDLVDYVKIHCSEDSVNKIIQIMMADIKKLKSEVVSHRIKIDNLQSISLNIFDIKTIVETFIHKHENDGVKIVAALGVIIILIMIFCRGC